MTKHSTHRIDANSAETYRSERTKFSKRCSEIVKAFARIGEPATDRQIMAIMGMTETNMVRPRITELIDQGVLVKIDNINCPVTGKTVRACQLNG